MTTTATRHRSEKHVSHPAFRADEQFAGHLQQLLVDLNDLALQGKQAHWNIVGPNFRDLHLQLDEIIDAADPTTADRLHTILERLEQLAWLTDAERRTPGASVPEAVQA